MALKTCPQQTHVPKFIDYVIFPTKMLKIMVPNNAGHFFPIKIYYLI
jgi:hypothetical protein